MYTEGRWLGYPDLHRQFDDLTNLVHTAKSTLSITRYRHYRALGYFFFYGYQKSRRGNGSNM